MTRSFFSPFARDTRGAAAVEFAIVAPVLALLLVGLVQGWFDVKQRMDAQTALQAGIRYYHQGGATDATAKALAIRAWPNKPAEGDVLINRSCTCSQVVVLCTATCDSTPPAVTVSVATTYRANSLLGSENVQFQQSVRIR